MLGRRRNLNFSAERLADARKLYQNKRVPIAQVRDCLGVRSNAVAYYVAHREGWVRGLPGRCTSYTPEQLAEAEQLWHRGASSAAIADVLGLSNPDYVYDVAGRSGWKPRKRPAAAGSRFRREIRKALQETMPKPGRRKRVYSVRKSQRVEPSGFGSCVRCGFRAVDDPQYTVRLKDGLAHRSCVQGRAA